MQIIHNSDIKTAKVWGEGKIQNKPYRLIHYIFKTDVEDGMLLLNTVTGELVLLNAEEAGEISKLPCDYTDWMDELIKNHFLVTTDFDDKKSVDTLGSAMRTLNVTREIVSYTILPTTNCNARCFYCYESGIKHENMSDETADKLVDFIDVNRGEKNVTIIWFGGEPLVGSCQIDRICKALKEKNVGFNSRMISNGYLFDRETAKHAKEDWNLKVIQITLDGTEKIYNKTKAYINPCESPFNKVLDNIGYLMDNGITVFIRLNLGMHNADDLSKLIEILAERFEDKTYLRVYPSILFDDCGFDPVHFSEKEYAVLMDKQNELQEQVRSYAPVGIKEPLPKLKPIPCSVYTKSLVVFPSGKLGKCQHYADSHFVGDLDNGVTDLCEVEALRELVLYPECAECPHYPFCRKPKYCEINNECIKQILPYKEENIINTMKLYYEDFINGRETEEAEKEMDC